jgi:hypothetical protein
MPLPKKNTAAHVRAQEITRLRMAAEFEKQENLRVVQSCFDDDQEFHAKVTAADVSYLCVMCKFEISSF